ncbi:hypothetical protein QL285_093488 [Trifolium repens]|nr:hypothetical protein QL285_093488 [Trifolium repens]
MIFGNVSIKNLETNKTHFLHRHYTLDTRQQPEEAPMTNVLNQGQVRYREKDRDKKVLVPIVTVFHRFYIVKKNHAKTPIRPR